MPTEPSDPRATDPAAPALQLSPEIEQPGDRVPHLRADLLILPRSGEAGLFDVCLQEQGSRAFTLYDIEVSIARMLDGKRTAAQLIEGAGKIGIPVTVDSLRKFVRQLRAYGFIDDSEQSSDDESSTWAPRTQWRPEIRELFQSALRTFRNDRPAEARGYLEALFQIEPDVPEAQELMQRIEERILSAEAQPLPSFDALHSEDVDLTDFEGSEGDPTARVSEDAFEEDGEAPAPKRRWPLVALGVATLGVAGVMAIPVPNHVSASAELVAAGTPHTLTAPRSGRVAELLVTPGKWVKSGEKLLRLDDSELEARIKVIQDDLSGLQEKMDRIARRAESSSARRAKSSLEKKEAQVAKMAKLRDSLASRSDSKSRRRLAKLEKNLAKKQHEVASAEASYQRKIGSADLKALEAEKTAKQTELSELDTQRTKSVLVANGDGDFEPSRRVGDPVISGETIATLVDARKMKVTIGVPARQAMMVKEGQPVSIRLAGTDRPLRTTVLSTSGESAGPGLIRATAAVENADLKLAPGTSGLAEIDCGSDRLYTVLIGKK